nr:type II toxin-antitoxin system RelE/ParE family toxin [Haloactinopolyspora sp.]
MGIAPHVINVDLRVPPGDRLEKLHGDRAGQYSIRINQQWRICFRWTPAGPEDIEIVDCLQSRYDLEIEKDKLADALARIEPLAGA